jgi:hypothetical protein
MNAELSVLRHKLEKYFNPHNQSFLTSQGAKRKLYNIVERLKVDLFQNFPCLSRKIFHIHNYYNIYG